MDGRLTGYTHVQVFSSTMGKDRAVLGQTVTEWINAPAQRSITIVETVVKQSSDNEFHCLSIIIFYRRA